MRDLQSRDDAAGGSGRWRTGNARLAALFASTLVQRGSMLLLAVLAARLLGAAEYGIFALMYGVCTAIAGFLGDALGATVNTYAAEGASAHERADSGAAVLSFALAGALALGAAVTLLAPLLAPLLGGAPGLAACLRLAGPVMACMLVNTVLIALLNTWQHSIAAARAALAASLLTFGLSMAGALAGGALGMGAGLALGSACASVLYLLLLRRLQPFRFAGADRVRAFAVSPRMRAFTLPALATMALGGPVHLLCLGMLAASPDGLHKVGIFTALFQWYLVMTFVPAALMNVTIPWLARARAASAACGRRAAGRAVLASLGLGTAMCALLLLARGPLLALYGPDFQDQGSLLWLVGLCGLLACVVAVMNHAAWAAGRAMGSLAAAGLHAAAYLGAAFVLVSLLELGVAGLAGAALAAGLLQCLVQLHFFFFDARNAT